MMKTYPVAILALALSALVTAGCGEPQAPRAVPRDSTELPDPPSPPLLEELHVSDPVALTEATSASAHRSRLNGVTYISLPPGAIPNGETITVQDRRSGESVSAPLVLGGVDPLAVEATAGDTLDIRISLSGSPDTLRYISLVPLHKPPVIVRTSPPVGRRDLPLNSVLILVFSEPIERGTLTDTTLYLVAGGKRVSGTIDFADSAGVMVRFTPAQPLAPGTSYVLTADGTITDLGGEALGDPISLTFTTVNGAPSTTTYERESPHSAPGTHSRFLVRNDGIVELQYESPDGPVSYIGQSFQAGPATLLIDFGLNQSGAPREAYATQLDNTHLGIAYNFGMIQAGAEEGVYASAIDSMTVAGPSPAGQIAFVRNGGIYLVNSDGTGLTQLTAGPNDAYPAWSPDGQRIAFTRPTEPDPVFGQSVDIFIMNADGSNLVRRTTGGLHQSVSWSPDGQWLVTGDWNRQYPQDAPGGFSLDLYKLRPADDGSSPINLTNRQGFEGYPAWSPDGTRIAFSSDWAAFDFVSNIYTTTPAGGTPIQVKPGWHLEDYFPSWSPDGQRLAFTGCPWAFYYCSSSSIHIMNANGTGVLHLAVTSGFSRTAWSTDGRTILFEHYGSLAWVRADGSARGIIIGQGSSPAWRP